VKILHRSSAMYLCLCVCPTAGCSRTPESDVFVFAVFVVYLETLTVAYIVQCDYWMVN
jgi:hypothetical protein